MEKSIELKSLKKGSLMFYEYDEGSTTSIIIKVIKIVANKEEEYKDITIVNRNDPPKVNNCTDCENPLDRHCLECRELYCDNCRASHSCSGEEMSLPIMNSPRTGICGYGAMGSPEPHGTSTRRESRPQSRPPLSERDERERLESDTILKMMNAIRMYFETKSLLNLQASGGLNFPDLIRQGGPPPRGQQSRGPPNQQLR